MRYAEFTTAHATLEGRRWTAADDSNLLALEIGKADNIRGLFPYAQNIHLTNAVKLIAMRPDCKWFFDFLTTQLHFLGANGVKGLCFYVNKHYDELQIWAREDVGKSHIDFPEDLLAELIAKHMSAKGTVANPTFATAFEIYMRESNAPARRKFTENATRNFNYFQAQFGDLPLDELRHIHGTQFRDAQLARGLNPTSVRKQFATLNAVLNLAFRHLDINRLSPFRAMHIQGEGEITRHMETITPDLLEAVKQRLLRHQVSYRLVGLIQLNTGLRLSEPIFARLEDCVLDHEIPHLWIRRNALSDRKTKASIRCVPLVGVSLAAAKKLHAIATEEGSEWFVPHYARYNGSTTCSATMNKCLLDLNFRTHMFRHALIDRMKACNDIPTRLAESITGHHSGGSEFNSYGTVGYTLEQKLAVIKRVEI